MRGPWGAPGGDVFDAIVKSAAEKLGPSVRAEQLPDPGPTWIESLPPRWSSPTLGRDPVVCLGIAIPTLPPTTSRFGFLRAADPVLGLVTLRSHVG